MMQRALRSELVALEGANLRRRFIDARGLLDFSSNDYLGFGREEVTLTSRQGAGASRLVTGNLEAHERLEASLAAFVDCPTALLFSSGYAANVGALRALLSKEDVVFSDALNHASLIDGCRLARATTHVFRHRDTTHLRELLEAHRGASRRALVITDALFSMDGDRADLRGLRALCDEYDAWLFVDEAHSVGVFGANGAGLCSAAGVQPDVLVGTLGKAFGVMGAFVAGSAELREVLIHRARSFVFSTGVSPLVVEAVTLMVPRLRAAHDRRERLQESSARIRAGLAETSLSIMDSSESAILPVLVGDERRAMELEDGFHSRGLVVRAIRPPTVARGTSRLRIVASAAHTSDDIERLIRAARELG